MKTGQIIGSILGALGLGALIYFGVQKATAAKVDGADTKTPDDKGNTVKLNKSKSSGSGIMDSTTNPNSGFGLTKPSTTSYPSTGFTTSAQGNAFRKWFNLSFPTTAKNIQLNKTGAYDNDYIRKAYALKKLEWDAYLKSEEGIAFVKANGNFLNLGADGAPVWTPAGGRNGDRTSMIFMSASGQLGNANGNSVSIKYV